MKKHIFAAALASAFIPAIALAADLPTKAPISPFSVNSGGWYAGIASEAAVEQANVSGNNLFATSLVNGNLKAAGGAIGGVVGYIRTGCIYGSWCRVQAGGFYQNITGSNSNGSVASRWSSTQEVDLGVEVFSAITSVIGNVGVAFPTFSPSLPSNVLVAAAPRQYVGFGAREIGIDGNFLSATGSTVSVAPMLKTGYLWQTLGANGAPNGFTVTNAFATSGGPVFTSGIKEGTQYGLGIAYAFGVGR